MQHVYEDEVGSVGGRLVTPDSVIERGSCSLQQHGWRHVCTLTVIVVHVGIDIFRCTYWLNWPHHEATQDIGEGWMLCCRADST